MFELKRREFLKLLGALGGALSMDGRIAGTYIHGLFVDTSQRSAWLQRLGGAASAVDYEAGVEDALEDLARHIEAYLDLDRILTLAR